MLRRNPTFSRLKEGYLFPEIEKRTRAFQERHPRAPLINLGVGDAVLPLPHPVASAMARFSLALSTEEGFRGYGPEEGAEEEAGHDRARQG